MPQSLAPIHPPATVPKPYLEIRQEGAATLKKAVSSAPGTAVIGRAANCDVVLNHPSVSRRHAELERLPGGWRVRDLKSRNGTRVNEVPVTEQTLYPGDLLHIGQFTLRLVGEDQPSTAGLSRGP